MNKLKILALLTAAILTQTANAGVPVSVVADPIGTAEHAESIIKFVEQIEQLKAQLNQAKAQFESLNGVRGMGQLIYALEDRKYLPNNTSEIFEISSNTMNSDGLSGRLSTIKQAAGIFKGDSNKSPHTYSHVNNRQTELARMQAMAESAYDAAGQRFEQLHQYADQVDLATDPKAALDLRNSIATEQLMLQNEHIKLATLANLQKSMEQQRIQQSNERIANFGLRSSTPVVATRFQSTNKVVKADDE